MTIPILIVSNFYLIYKIIAKNSKIERSIESEKKRRATTISVATVTLLYAGLNLPVVIIYYIGSENSSDLAVFFSFKIVYSLFTTSYCTSFLSLYKSNEAFRAVLKNLLSKCCSIGLNFRSKVMPTQITTQVTKY